MERNWKNGLVAEAVSKKGRATGRLAYFRRKKRVFESTSCPKKKEKCKYRKGIVYQGRDVREEEMEKRSEMGRRKRKGYIELIPFG